MLYSWLLFCIMPEEQEKHRYKRVITLKLWTIMALELSTKNLEHVCETSSHSITYYFFY